MMKTMMMKKRKVKGLVGQLKRMKKSRKIHWKVGYISIIHENNHLRLV